MYVLFVFVVDSEGVSVNVVNKNIKVDFEDIIIGIGLVRSYWEVSSVGSWLVSSYNASPGLL